MTYTVRSLTLESPDVLAVELVGPELPDWTPGAHLDVVVGDGTVRQFSLCGEPGASSLTIAVRHEPAGRGGSAWVHTTLRPGHEVTVRGVKNHFALEPEAPVVLIAGGVGITPLLPMAGALAGSDRAWHLHYVGRDAVHMPFLDRVRGFGPHATVHETAASGRPDIDVLLADISGETLVYVCGPESLITGVRSVLESRGWEDRLRAEYFAAPDVEAAEPGTFTLRLEQSGLELVVPADKSALDVVTEAGIDLLSDCEEGICGSCWTKVLSGEVDHRDHVLTSAEKADNDCMMMCVSRALGSRLVVDL